MILAGHLITPEALDTAPADAASGRTPGRPGWIRVQSGQIAEIGEGSPPHDAGDRPTVFGQTTRGGVRILIPAFIDAHLHIPQFDSVGCDGMPLHVWLDRVAFPAEQWFGAGAWGPMTRGAIRRLIHEGTFGFAGYLSTHGEASAGSAGLLAASGLRCVVGRVAMDREAPDDLTAYDRDRAAMRPPPSPLLPRPFGRRRLHVSANPRSAMTCSEELLAEVGWLRREAPGLIIQTHLAESADEAARVRALFPGDADATAALDRLGVIGPGTLLAGCSRLTGEEWDILARRGAVAVHCPTADLFLQAGLFDLGAARARGVRVALGSDVGAGSDRSMPRVARAMIETAQARALAGIADRAEVPTPADAWRMITTWNADALGWSDGGRLAVGAQADVLALRVPETWMDQHLLGRLLYGWSPGLIEARVLGGDAVAEDGPDTIRP